MKKTMSAIAAIAIITSMVSALPTFAESQLNTEIKSGTVQFTHSVSESYIVKIPDDVKDLTKDSTLEVSASDVVIATGNVLDVSVSSNKDWKLVNEANDEVAIGYELSNGDAETALANDDKVLSIEAGNFEGGSTTIKVKSIDKAVMAGTYVDTLTFTVDVNEKATPATTASSEETTTTTTASSSESGETGNITTTTTTTTSTEDNGTD